MRPQSVGTDSIGNIDLLRVECPLPESASSYDRSDVVSNIIDTNRFKAKLAEIDTPKAPPVGPDLN